MQNWCSLVPLRRYLREKERDGEVKRQSVGLVLLNSSITWYRLCLSWFEKEKEGEGGV